MTTPAISMALPHTRLLSIAGASNFRDWGGYATQSGASIRSGRLFRSAQLGSVTAQGVNEFRALGIRTIVDLRGERERQRALPHFAKQLGVQVVSCPLLPGSGESLRSMLSRRPHSIEEMGELMCWIYRCLVREELTAVGVALRAILAAADQPLVVHCAAGKDRTGFIVATVLSLLGAPHERIIEDYLLTNVHWDRQGVAGIADLPAELSAVILAADAAYLEAAFAAMQAEYGSVDAFAARATGVADFGAQLRASVFAG